MRNHSLCTVSFDFTKRFLPAVYIFVFIVGLIANVCGLISLRRNWRKLSIINIFVLNLGVADLLYLLTLPFLVVYTRQNRWMFGDVFCKITRFCFNLNLYGSIGFLTCISVYRYLAIVHPVRWRGWGLTASHSTLISAAVWLLVFVQCLPDMFFTKTFRNTSGKCYDTTSKHHVEEYLRYSLGWTVSGFCLPFLVILGCYGHLVLVLCTGRRGGAGGRGRNAAVMRRRGWRLLVILTLLFSVCYAPYHVVKNLNLHTRILTKQNACRHWFNGVYIARQVSRGLVCLNSVINPLVYLHGNEDLWKQLRRGSQRAWQLLRHLPVNTPSSGDSASEAEGNF